MALRAPRSARWHVPRALGALALGLAACGSGERPGTPPRHLVLVTVDTLRADHLSAWLYGRPTSRIDFTEVDRERGANLAIDDLAEQGVVLRNAFAPRGQTMPSLATLMTGRPPLEHGVLENGRVLPEEAETLAERLRAEGFATAAFTSNKLLVPVSGLAQGFDTFECLSQGDRDLEVVKAGLAWLKTQDLDDGAPVFLWLHLMGPHLPYDPQPFGGREFAAEFTDMLYAGGADGSREFLDAAYLEGRPLDPLDLEHVVGLYDGEVARVNALVSSFLQVYDGVYDAQPAHRLDDTLLVFAADHGEELSERHGYWAHSKSVYSSVLHVPLILRHPPSLTGRRVFDDLVTLADVLPTVCEWFDVAPPVGVRGRSLLPRLDGDEPAPSERVAFATWREAIVSVTADLPSGRWRLVWNPEGVEPDDKPPGPYPIPTLALFDRDRDPGERFDVAAEHPEVVEDLRARIAAWLAGLQPVAGEAVVAPELEAALDDLGYGQVGSDDE